MQAVGFIKRLIVIAYDGLLLFAVAFFTSALLMAIFQLLAPDSFFIAVDQLENPLMIERTDLGRTIGGAIIVLNCICVSFFFYGWFWTHGGQTLGMKAWNLYLIKPDGKFINWRMAVKRYLAALLSWLPLGMGYTWILLNPDNKAWHDTLTNTQIVYVAPKK